MAKVSIPIVINVEEIKEYLEKADIVEVVRCRECRWYDHICWRVETEFMESDFCSYGEKNNDNNTRP